VDSNERDAPRSGRDSPVDLNEQDEQVAAAQANMLQAQAAALHALLNDEPNPEPDEEELPALVQSQIEHVRLAQQFIEKISTATLNNGNLDDDVIERLRNPEEGPIDISDPNIRLALDLFMACEKSSQNTYTSVREAILRRFPETELLSYHLVNKLVTNISGVVSIKDDMCINSCHAFTGPFVDLEACSICLEPRYDPIQLGRTGKKIPRQQACTIPLGPQIQALRRSPQGAQAMRYRDQKTQEILESIGDPVYDDLFSGSDILNLSEDLKLTSDDTTASFSFDGAQLYQNKKSDTWIAIWIINDYSPDTRYKKKHVLPALIVPGPNKPKNLDSFLFRTFHHVSAIQRENNGVGLCAWDGLKEEIIYSRVIVLLNTADAVALTELDGRVGHHGAQGCRLGCSMKGRHKPSSGHYYAVHLRPNAYTVSGCDHPDIDIRNLTEPSPEIYKTELSKIIHATDQNDYEKKRKETGISKPSILSGLVKSFALPMPLCFSVDLMHLLCLNIGELFIPLWRGQLKCDPTDEKDSWDWATLVDDTWIAHGKLVAEATKYFPSFFHRPPRNPVEKISSGYKATEYYLYIFGLGPGFFRAVLPKKYWQNLCKLVHGARILIQHRITSAQVREAHSSLIQFVEEYEHLYYQRRTDRLHFCRPWLHTLLHTAPEILRVGPGCYASQNTMERAIGDLGKDIRQPSNPFANLSQIALRRSQMNALLNICPELDPSAETIPTGNNVGNGYFLLTPRERYASSLGGEIYWDAVHTEFPHMMGVRKWGRLNLPNGQIARSLYSETQRKGKSENTRISRNVKVSCPPEIQIPDAHNIYFTRYRVKTLRMVGLNMEKFSFSSIPPMKIQMTTGYQMPMPWYPCMDLLILIYSWIPPTVSGPAHILEQITSR